MPASILVIDAPEAMPLIDQITPPPTVILLRLPHLTAMMLEQVRPDCIVLPLLRAGFDAVQVLGRLNGFGYSGHICAITPPLPDRAMVEAELRAISPQAAVCLIEIADMAL